MTIESRVGKLERRSRRVVTMAGVMVGLVALMAFIAGGMVSAQPESEVADELRTRQLVIVDEHGRARVGLAVYDGTELPGAKGGTRLNDPGADSGPALLLFDAAGEHHIILPLDRLVATVESADDPLGGLRTSVEAHGAWLEALAATRHGDFSS